MARKAKRGPSGSPRRLSRFGRSPATTTAVKQRRLTFESLELRHLLSASSLIATPLNSRVPGPTITNNTILGYTPGMISAAYGFNQLTSFSISGGGTEPANGAGQTIAIVDAYNDPNIASDLAAFDAALGLAAPPSFTIVSQTGSTIKLPVTNAGWDTEISLDVEWAHAIAPGAKILLVEATSDRWTDLLAAVNYAKSQPQVSVVSMSWGVSEYRLETATDSTFTTPASHPVSFVAAAGDWGSPPLYPAISPNVLGVGGTTLNLTAGGSYTSETAWSDGTGGVSMVEKEPAYQTGAQNTGYRVGPDVAYDADPNTGFAIYDTVNDGYGTGWTELGGTSAGAPQWAALLAIADEGLAAAGKPAIANAQARVYSLPASAFHDITTGNNGTYAAGVGYDAVTGLGTPIANVLIPDLINGVTGSPTGVSSIKSMHSPAGGGSGGTVVRSDMMAAFGSTVDLQSPGADAIESSGGNIDSVASLGVMAFDALNEQTTLTTTPSTSFAFVHHAGGHLLAGDTDNLLASDFHGLLRPLG